MKHLHMLLSGCEDMVQPRWNAGTVTNGATARNCIASSGNTASQASCGSMRLLLCSTASTSTQRGDMATYNDKQMLDIIKAELWKMFINSSNDKVDRLNAAAMLLPMIEQPAQAIEQPARAHKEA